MTTPEITVQVATKIKYELDYYYSLTKILGLLSKLLSREREFLFRMKETKATTEERKKIRAGKIKQIKINIGVHSSDLENIREEIEEIEARWLLRPNLRGFEEVLSEAKSRFLAPKAKKGENSSEEDSSSEEESCPSLRKNCLQQNKPKKEI